ncbi:DUF6232 family protein [Verrucosispora sp. WMMD573]|uniref:DUF6232 family protein n=1 Tax=Verrucosispora sp. WMMD573 TaxID=3015149 RepID=UPI00248D1655|nr:DUF6232 family protein [Verrucosispora sp. WMMD573]WBB56085.1 DUF6232 family protein [Verrucosispora sp. WMMD573]
MTEHSGVTQIRVNRATLWIGGDVYQLSSIARVRSLMSEPDRRGIGRAIARACGWFAGGVLLLCCVGQMELPGFALVLVAAAVLGVIAYHVWQAIRLARQATQYALVVETNGATSAALVSTDRAMVEGLVNLIANALENPPTREIVQNIDNRKLVFGDEINMMGGGVQIGKVARGD